MNNAQLINQDSGDTEYYTPLKIIEAAREVMGEIDFDPASSENGNELVGAYRYLTIEDKSHSTSVEWKHLNKEIMLGSMWMNHPFSKGEKACPVPHSKCKKKKCKDRGYHITEDIPGNIVWINKFLEADFVHKMCITFANTSEKWCQLLLEQGSIHCFLKGRTNFIKPNVKLSGSTKGCFITYIGPNIDKFKEVFSKIGVVK